MLPIHTLVQYIIVLVFHICAEQAGLNNIWL